MARAIADTGPILHLAEIDQLLALRIFEQLLIPDLVQDELLAYGINLVKNLPSAREPKIEVTTTKPHRLAARLRETKGTRLHRADAAVLILAEETGIEPILTDDLDLRRVLEAQGRLVVGTVGVLTRAYADGLLTRPELDMAIENLFQRSTLFISSSFRQVIYRLLVDLS